MATTPQGDDIDVRRAVMAALAKQVARQRIASSLVAGNNKTQRPRRLTATFRLPSKAPRPAGQT
jgi:hypothetical protein